MITNGKLIGANYDSREYLKNEHPRGSKGYVMSRSDLLDFASCPSRWIKGGKVEDETDSTEWGSLVDCLLTDGARFKDRFAIKPETYPIFDKRTEQPTGETKPWNGNSTWCKEWIAAQGGKTCISQAEHDDAVSAAERIAKELESDLTQHQVYVTADYCDAETGLAIPLKALIDVVPSRSGSLGKGLLDIKTGRCGDPAKWARVCFQRGYHVQSAMQLDLYDAATNEGRNEFYHIVQENFYPYEISFPFIDPTFVSLGRQKYLHALQLYALCLKTGEWATYDDLQRETYNGHPIISPEAWMVEPAPTIKDPDWVSA